MKLYAFKIYVESKYLLNVLLFFAIIANVFFYIGKLKPASEVQNAIEFFTLIQLNV